VLIINSNVKHELAGSEYGERRRQCESAARVLGTTSLRNLNLDQLEASRDQLANDEYRRARHAISEIARTREAADAVIDGNWPQVGELMLASHESLRDDYEVSCPELDLLVELAKDVGTDGGVFGSRMTGGGFGGCTVSLVKTAQSEEVAQYITDRYQRKTDITPSSMISRPARGAHVIKN